MGAAGVPGVLSGATILGGEGSTSDLLIELLCCYGGRYCGVCFGDSSKGDLGFAGGGGGLQN